MEETEEELGTRQRQLTEKGLEYQKDIKQKEIDRLIRTFKNKSEHLEELLCKETSEENTVSVRNSYSEWLRTFDELMSTKEDIQRLSSVSEGERLDNKLSENTETFYRIKHDAEQWILSSARTYEDDTRSLKSKRSNRSHSSSTSSTASSHLSIAKLKESQKKAELLARAAALGERKRIEEEKLNLRIKEEQFELKTEIEISDAKSKVIDELSKSMMQDQRLEEEILQTNIIGEQACADKVIDVQPHVNKETEQKSRTISSKPKFTLPTKKSDDNFSSSEELFKVSRELNKPKADIQNFSGNPMEYQRFIRQFNARVCANTESYEERLNFLLQFTFGEANRIVSGYSNLESKKGYEAAMSEFEERYGDADVIARAYVKKSLEWPTIKPNDARALDDYAIFLRECQFAIEQVQAVKVLEYSENLKLLVQKLPFYLHDKWRNIVYEKKATKTGVRFEDLVFFIRKEAKKANDPIFGKEILNSKCTDTKQNKSSNVRKNFATGVDDDSENKCQDPHSKSCTYCAEQHPFHSCDNVTKLLLKDRYAFIKSKGLCFACLKPGHTKRNCRHKSICNHCQRSHPTILHVDSKFDRNQIQTSELNAAAHMRAGKTGQQALPIVPVRLKSQKGDKFIETYAFLDSGSTATFCTERARRQLQIEGKRTRISLLTMGQERIIDTYEVMGLEISSLDGQRVLELPSVLTQKALPVSRQDLTFQEDLKVWPHLNHVQIEELDCDVDLLIGINVPKAMEPWDVVPSKNGGPFAVKTMFGWVVNGPLEVPETGSSHYIRANYIKTTTSLDSQLRDHFNRDFPERTIDDKLENSQEDNQFIKLVSQSINKKDGHYSIDLPFKSENTMMPNNINQAKQRLALLSKRFDKDVKFKEAYIEFMSKVINKGYAQRVTPNDLPESGRVWYLPHHGVYHPKKNKIRVVFDCAARYGGTSLNDQLLQGPNLTNSLIGTLIRFRQERVAIMGDIESMYYQVQVSIRDRNFQRFLWWPDGNTCLEPVEYQMKVHLFGSTSSPSCANFALRQTAEDVKGKFNEEVINTVLKNMYVDDCLKSVESEKNAVSLVKDLQSVLKSGGFHISKWVSNNREVMRSIPIGERAAEVKDLDLDCDKLPVERTLGVNWNAESDVFSFTVDVKEHSHTRRGILSTVSSIYDPLGFIAPMILSAKSMLQELCQLQIGWDDPAPETYDKKWCCWLEGIRELRSFEVARCFKPPGFGAVASSELHHFSDASERGYGTVSYLRLINTEGDIHCSFVIGRSRVAPLKKVTVPRLELTAATVAVRTDKMLKNELDMKIDRTFFWTDSMSVVRYIRNSTSRFHTFVANRLTVIHEGSSPEEWHYVGTKLNPADVASRGLPVDQNQWKRWWIEAPSFLFSTEDKWPTMPKDANSLVEEDPEVKRVVVRSTVTNQVDFEINREGIDKLICKYSLWYKLKRSVAWILKVRDELLRRVNSKNGNSSQVDKTKRHFKLTTVDLKRAEMVIITYVQKQTFNSEMKSLEQGESQVSKRSSIRKLDPIIEDGIMRVGGRLHKSNMPAESKHPAILPKSHPLTTLVLRQFHEDLLHAGRNHMLSALRRKYWVVNAPSAIRKLLSKCVICRRYSKPLGEQKMATLPEDRVTPDEPPFTRVGVDYFGPFEVKLKRSRVKRYGVIFTCLASRAVHLEIAFSLDTDSYINALRRFIARRGQVQIMCSDNGTNFVGAERELRESISEWNCEQVHEAMLQKNIDWKFNPPSGSHHGGVWERLIRSIRKAMNSTLRQQVLDDEGLQTLTCEIEATLNSRPITRNSDGSNDLEALTPNHLLLLAQNPNLPPGLFSDTDIYCRKRWRQVQYIANLFWKRWIREYLPLLQERQKWFVTRRNLQVGDVVLIVDSSAPRGSWPMGLIIETLPDRSGYVRQVKVKTATYVLKRPIDKLCVILEAE